MNRICPAHVEYARYLDRCHGREIAKNYLRKISSPDYMSVKKLKAVKHAETSLKKQLGQRRPDCPPEGWRICHQNHIQKVGDEILAAQPDIELKALEKAITKTYAHGSTSTYAYKVWREELRAYIKQISFEQLGRQLADSYHPPHWRGKRA